MAKVVQLKSSYGVIPFPQNLVLSATVGAGKNKLYVAPSIGLFTEGGIINGDSQEFDVNGFVTTTAVREFLKTHALIVTGIKYSSSNALQMNNPIKVTRVGLKEEQMPTTFEVAASRDEDANNDKLVTLDAAFVWDNQTGITVSSTEAYEVGLVLMIGAAIPYGNLEKFLAENMIPVGDNCKC